MNSVKEKLDRIQAGLNILNNIEDFPEYIKPINTYDATADEGSMLKGRSAYVNGKKVTGTIERNWNMRITPSTEEQIAAPIHTCNMNNVIVEGDTDLVADNIRAGKEIFGVAGSSWAGNLTFSGTYANATYYTAAGSFLDVNKDTGRAFITIQGGTSTTYENVYFTASSLPSGVTLLTPPGGTNGAGFGTGGTAKRYFTAVLTGVTGKINVAVTMSTLSNTSYDAVNCALKVTYA
jgi:hypothetical protein